MKSTNPKTGIWADHNISHVDKTAGERADLLDKIQWMDSFEWKQVECLARFVQMYKAKSDAVIFREGDRQAFLALIVAGRVEILKKDSNRHQQQVAVLGRGQALGEMSLIDNEPRSATARAATDVCLMILEEKAFGQLMEEQTHLALKLVLKIAHHMSQRLRRTSGQLVDAVGQPEKED